MYTTKVNIFLQAFFCKKKEQKNVSPWTDLFWFSTGFHIYLYVAQNVLAMPNLFRNLYKSDCN